MSVCRVYALGGGVWLFGRLPCPDLCSGYLLVGGKAGLFLWRGMVMAWRNVLGVLLVLGENRGGYFVAG